jgi:hypothetical protein
MKRIVSLLVAMCLAAMCLALPVRARIQGADKPETEPDLLGESAPAPHPSSPSIRNSQSAIRNPELPSRLSLTAGPALLFSGSRMTAVPALALRYHPWAAMSDERRAMDAPGKADRFALPTLRSLLSFELGTVLPLSSRGELATETRADSGQTWHASIQSFYEVHLAALADIPILKADWLVPEAGLGISLAHLVNRVEWSALSGFNPSSGTSRSSRTSVSPFFLIGLRILLSDRVSLNLGASYASNADTFRSFGRDFDLAPSGWTLRPALEIRM